MLNSQWITLEHSDNQKLGLSELSWENQPQIEEQLRQRKEQEKDQLTNNSNFTFSKKTKKRQTSLAEFTG